MTFESDRHFIEASQYDAEKYITAVQGQLIQLEKIRKKLRVVDERYRKKYSSNVVDIVYKIQPFLLNPPETLTLDRLKYIMAIQPLRKGVKSVALEKVPYKIRDIVTAKELEGINKPFITKTLDSLFRRK